jgi:type I restriction enzyme S subunit
MKKIFNQEIRFKDNNGSDFTDWEEKRLNEISKFRRGSFPQPYGLPEWYDDINGKPFVQVFDVGENFKLKPQTKQKISSLAEPKSVFVPKESVVITIQGSIGRVAITQYDSYVDRTLLIFKELNGYLDKYFFVYQLYRLFEIEKRRAPGGTIKTITKEKLSSFTIQIPEKNEQLKISNFLFSIDKQLELLDTQIDKSKTWKKGLLQKMFV